MSKKKKPERQHYMPRSYLNRFSRIIDNKKTVEVKDLDKDCLELKSTKSICFQRNIYTLPENDKIDRFAVEDFYQNKIDTIYPTVYKLLTNENIKNITPKQKVQILSTILSLHFRTPKTLNSLNKEICFNIEQALKISDPDRAEFNINYLGEELSYPKTDPEAIKNDIKERNRIEFVSFHLRLWDLFVKHKKDCELSVYHVEGNVDLITCDNPLIINSPNDVEEIKVFDSINLIQIPLDRRHFLVINPNDIDTKNQLTISRFRGEEVLTILLNNQIELNAEKFIIAYPDSYSKHLKAKDSLIIQDENLRTNYNTQKFKYHHLKELIDLMDLHKIDGIPVRNKVDELLTLKEFETDPTILLLKKIHTRPDSFNK